MKVFVIAATKIQRVGLWERALGGGHIVSSGSLRALDSYDLYGFLQARRTLIESL